MNLDKLIEVLEGIRDEVGHGLVFVENANTGMLMYEDAVELVDMGDIGDPALVVHIG